VLAVVVSAGDDIAVRADLRSVECSHGIILLPPGAARPKRQVALACTADRELNLNLSTECWTIPQDFVFDDIGNRKPAGRKGGHECIPNSRTLSRSVWAPRPGLDDGLEGDRDG
jgi:hypothetical protein